ncbi:MAG TPA: hypothetical protein VFJ09_08535 [Nocardioidaceae bacterium]|nr:hypothetical protein [Nocardioidaceae bacterium]
MAEDSPTVRSLVIGLVSLVFVSLIIGGVFSLFALGAVNVAGLANSGPAPKPSLYMPPLSKHPSPGAGPSVSPSPAAPSSPASTEAPAAQSPSASPTKRHHHRRHQITLAASPLHASPSERIDLSGRYPGGDGTVLQVQNYQSGSWTTFPVSVTVSGSTFRTYIYSGNPGPQRFRVVDTSSGRASNPVTVTIG